MKIKKIILSCIVLGFSVFVFMVVDAAIPLWKVKQAVAVGGFPAQFGITGVTIVPCTWPGTGPCTCVPPSPLPVLDTVNCVLVSQVSGTPAGGDGAMVLMKKTDVVAAGISAGGQLIAGGSSSLLTTSYAVGGTTGAIYGKAAFNLVMLTDKVQTWFKALI